MKEKYFLSFVIMIGCADLLSALSLPNKGVNKLNINSQNANNIVNKLIIIFEKNLRSWQQ
jgi:hypothetical protein